MANPLANAYGENLAFLFDQGYEDEFKAGVVQAYNVLDEADFFEFTLIVEENTGLDVIDTCYSAVSEFNTRADEVNV